jgi:hypothetical protein
MPENKLSREKIIAPLVEALKAQDFVIAAWEMGAAAFKRVDEWSDIDLIVDVEDDSVQQTADVIEKTLESLSRIELKYDLPLPTWHGHRQIFYRLSGAGRFLLVDAAIMKHSSKNKFLEPEIHNEMIWFFNKGDRVTVPSLEPEKFMEKLKKRFEELKIRFDMSQCFVEKEIPRGNRLEAKHLYEALTLKMLVEVLRMKYTPEHYDFHTKYIHYELPKDVVEKLQDLFYVADTGDLQRKHKIAVEWFNEVVRDMDMSEIEKKLKK